MLRWIGRYHICSILKMMFTFLNDIIVSKYLNPIKHKIDPELNLFLNSMLLLWRHERFYNRLCFKSSLWKAKQSLESRVGGQFYSIRGQQKLFPVCLWRQHRDISNINPTNIFVKTSQIIESQDLKYFKWEWQQHKEQSSFD